MLLRRLRVRSMVTVDVAVQLEWEQREVTEEGFWNWLSEKGLWLIGEAFCF